MADKKQVPSLTGKFLSPSNSLDTESKGAFVKESVVVAEAVVDKICEKGAFYIYDKYLRTKDKPFGIIKSIQTLAEML